MRILFVEDSERLQRHVGTGLRRGGYAVDVAGNGDTSLRMALSTEYDVVVLDLMLPGKSGLDVLREMRDAGNNTPVLILTAKGTVTDRVRGLGMGADDYLVKPFAFEELLARVQALVRRGKTQRNPRIVIGELAIDTAARLVLHHDEPISLTPREYAMLEYLACHRGRVVPRAEIEDHIYDENAELSSNVVDSGICSIRRKLGKTGVASLIQTRRGMGYVLENTV